MNIREAKRIFQKKETKLDIIFRRVRNAVTIQIKDIVVTMELPDSVKERLIIMGYTVEPIYDTCTKISGWETSETNSTN